MNLRHKVRINVTDVNGNRNTVIEGGTAKICNRIFKRWFGNESRVLVLALGSSVSDVEVVDSSRENLITRGDCSG